MFEIAIIREIVEPIYSLAITFAIGKWAIYMAYLERGYDAIGGEYFLIILTYWVAWKTIHHFFNMLEELKNERERNKRRSRGTVKV